MFIFRLNKIKIFNNRERGRLFGLFGKSRAEMKVLSFVTTETTNLPNLDALMKATNPVKQQEILAQMVSTVISRRILTTVENVRDGQTLTFGDTGFAVYVSNPIPQKFDWLLTVIESDGDIRENAQWASDVLKSPHFGSFAGDLTSLLKTASKGAAAVLASPAYLASVAISKFAVDVLLEKGKKNKDDQVGLLYMSLNRPQHYPFGKRDVQDIDDLTGNMKVDYSLFGVDDVAVVPPAPEAPAKPKKEKKADKKAKETKKKDKPAVG
jgi:hypothetical protein